MSKRRAKHGFQAIPSQTKKRADDGPSWQELEEAVRGLSEAKFGAQARHELIAGVKCDCVIHLGNGSAVIVEISKESTIEKLRTDIAKFSVIRPYFIGQNIFPRCYFVTFGSPTDALIEAGKALHVEVHSVAQFFNHLLGLRNYVTLRKEIAFGSAIDLYSGQPDRRNYVPVLYYSESGETFSAKKIAERLVLGKTVVLLGDYGVGKSRCVKEVFSELTENFLRSFMNPIAVNLRDNWSLKRASEILTRHFTELGLGDIVADFLKICYSKNTVYLLDGFDEIGAQTWSDDPNKLLDIRQKSLAGVKELITSARGGILVTGREHYFNNDVEMMKCLGTDLKDLLILRCNQELTEKQFGELVGWELETLPAWLPKKPLIGTVIREIEQDAMENLLSSSSGQTDFWDLLITNVCEREAKINSALDAGIIRSLYSHIGRIARNTTTPLGPLSIKTINEAFEKTTGRPPTDESAIILQRLPGLGRIGAESLDRQFVDAYILDGLKAEDVLSIYSDSLIDPLQESWKHPVEGFGSFYLASKISSVKQQASVATYIKRNRDVPNAVLLSDLLSALYVSADSPIDFGGIIISHGVFSQLSFSDAQISNLAFNECEFGSVDFHDAVIDRVTLTNCVIRELAGYSSDASLPNFIKSTVVQHYQSVATLVAIKGAGLSLAQTFLLSSLRKLFLQPGGGRQESSMFKGYRDASSKKVCDKVIHLLVKEGLCQKLRGNNDALYIPDRSQTGRVKGIMSQMTHSKDPLWATASAIT